MGLRWPSCPGTYDVADASGERVGRIFREDPFRPYRCVKLRATTALRLRRRDHPGHAYGLKKTADLPAEAEELLLGGVTAVILADWWRAPRA